MADIDRLDHLRLSEHAQAIGYAVSGLAKRIRAEVLGGRLTVREAARITGYSRSKVGRLCTCETPALVVPIQWGASRL